MQEKAITTVFIELTVLTLPTTLRSTTCQNYLASAAAHMGQVFLANWGSTRGGIDNIDSWVRRTARVYFQTIGKMMKIILHSLSIYEAHESGEINYYAAKKFQRYRINRKKSGIIK